MAGSVADINSVWRSFGKRRMIFSTRNPSNALELHHFLTTLYEMREKIHGMYINDFDGEIRIDLHSQDAETEVLKKFKISLGGRRLHGGTGLLYRLMSEFSQGTEPARGDAEHLFSLIARR